MHTSFHTVWLENVRPGDVVELPNCDGYLSVTEVEECGGMVTLYGSSPYGTADCGMVGPSDLEVRITRRD